MESVTDEELPTEKHGGGRKMSYREQAAVRQQMKASVLAKKQRAARFRKALKKSNILKIKLWQNTMTRSDEPTMTRHSPPPPCLKLNRPRLSPDITSTTNYRYSSNNMSTNNLNQISSSTSSSSSSRHRASESDEGEEEEEEEEEENEKARESDSSESSVKSNKTSSLILSNKGDTAVDDVEDYIRSGKPIRAAAVAALEAVHGRSLSEEALQRLRKAYTIKPSLPKGRGRRTIAKRAAARPTRAPPATNWCQTCESLVHRNSYYQVGDIVCITRDDKPYFLQVQTLLKDWREGAYASMIWLTPKKGFKRHVLPFNPNNFDLRRDLPCHDEALDDVRHVMHCPLDYFDGHPSYWHPRPGMVYMRLGDPLVKFEPRDPPKKAEEKVEGPKPNAVENDKESALNTQLLREESEMDLEVEQFSLNTDKPDDKDKDIPSSSVSEISVEIQTNDNINQS